MRSHSTLRLISRIILASGMLVLLTGCENILRNLGEALPIVNVNVKITLTNGYTKEAYLIFSEYSEYNNASTLVQPGASRVLEYPFTITVDPKFEQTFDIHIRGESDGSFAALDHTIDYSKYSTTVDESDKTVSYCTVNVHAVFTGTSFTVTESQGS